MCQIKLAACLSVFQCNSSIVSYRIASYRIFILQAVSNADVCVMVDDIFIE